MPLFEEHENKWFVDLLMTWMEYDNFLFRMIEVAKNQIDDDKHKSSRK
jgi:hypothetical protein